ncbi:MAG: DUF2163 domain-containing protein [Bauldia sp.]|nr:DUF2163 domain-containing protein [Bauldia sp.]
MRPLPAALQAHVDARVTALCRCFRIARADGVVLGFTDHDRPLAFDGTSYEPADGLDASEDASATGFAVGGLEVLGALTSDRLDPEDLAAGLFDNAEVTVHLVNWTTPSERHLLRVGRLGEVTREDGAFRAEIRGLAASLDETRGRAFRPTCDADLGDGRCGIDLDDADYRGTGTVSEPNDRRRFATSGLSAFAKGWFDRGRLTFTSGANAGRASEVRTHRKEGGEGVIELWQAMRADIAPGDAFVVTAGCDKRFSTCRQKFDNGVNFRGFPHMPGNDFALTYARRGDDNDGKPVVE